MQMLKNINYKKNSFEYLFILNVFIIILTSHPFVFSLSFTDLTRYSAILSFFLLACFHPSFWNHKIKNPLFYLLFLICLIFSALFSKNFNSGYLVLFINFFIFIVLVQMISSLEGLGEKLKTLFVSLSVCYALLAIVGFLSFNYLGISTERIPLYQLFGNINLPLQFSTHDDCYGCVIKNGDYVTGYRYEFSKYYGMFANISWLDSSLKRYVGFTFEPTYTGFVFMLAILMVDDLYWLPVSIRRVMLCTLIGGIFCVFSLLSYVVIFSYLFILTLKLLKKDYYKIIFLSLFLFLFYILIADFVLKYGSGFERYKNIKDMLNYMVLNFTVVDYLFGRGSLWFHEIRGIHSGYLSIFSQYGVLITFLFIILWLNASKYKDEAISVLLVTPFALNVQISILFFVALALLLHQNNKVLKS